MKAILAMFVLTSVLNANADTVCSTADQGLKYVYDVIERGIPPRNGDLVSTETLILNGRNLGSNEKFKGLDWRSKFNLNFDGVTKNILETKDIGAGFATTYSIRIDSVVVGLPGLGHVITIDQFAICSEVNTAVP